MVRAEHHAERAIVDLDVRAGRRQQLAGGHDDPAVALDADREVALERESRDGERHDDRQHHQDEAVAQYPHEYLRERFLPVERAIALSIRSRPTAWKPFGLLDRGLQPQLVGVRTAEIDPL